MTKWSDEQLQAMRLRQRELLVSAAAGSGKTSVLVERIVQMVTDSEHPIDIDRLLIVTFTNAAASEMRTRLYKRLLQSAEEDPSNKHVRRQLTLIGQAHVQTIDSFCAYVLKNYFHVIHLDPSFRIGDEGELELLKNDTLEALLEKKYEEANPAFLDMTEYFATEKSDDRLEDLVKKIDEFSQSSPDPEAWLEHCLEPYRIETAEDLENSDWNRDCIARFSEMVGEIRRSAEKMAEIIHAPGGPAFLQPLLEADLELLGDLSALNSYQRISENVTPRWTRLSKNKTAEFDEDLYEEAKQFRNKYKDRVKQLLSSFALPVEEAVEDMKVARPAVESLISLVREFQKAFSEEKRKRGIISFNDGEHLALQILEQDGKPTDVAKAMADSFEEVLIDEYQDSNYLQERILRAVAKVRNGRRSVFMVGDMKQSIYRFRMARPELFVDKYDRFSDAEETPDPVGQKIELNANYRSRETVTAAVNFIFGRLMHKAVGNIDYTENEALHPKGEFKETNLPVSGAAELLLFADGEEESGERELPEDGGDRSANGEDAEEATSAMKEAAMIAGEIKRLVDPDGGIFVADKDAAEKGAGTGYRHAAYRDIVILLRSLSGGAGEAFADVLTSYGIPCYVNRKTGFYDTFEVRNALNVLKVIDNPVDDIALAAVMHSPVFGFSSTELASLRAEAGFGANGLYGCLRKALSNESLCSGLREKIRKFIDLIEKLRKASRDLHLSALLRKIYENTGLLRFAAAMAGGERRVANLQQLIVKAADYEKLSYTGVFNFIRYVERKRELSTDEGEMSTVSESDNIVRIMTIHTSKGLEYPIVFVAGMGRKINQRDSRGNVCFHSDLGIGVGAVRLDERTKRDTYFNRALKDTVNREALGEELRVLYVAMTRAKEKLYMTGVEKAEKLDAELLERLSQQASELTKGTLGLSSEAVPSNELLSSPKYLSWVLAALSEAAPVRVRILRQKDLELSAAATEEKDRKTADTLDAVFSQETTREAEERINTLLSFNPHFDDLQDIPATLSVSALKAAAYREMEDPEDDSVCMDRSLFCDNKDLITDDVWTGSDFRKQRAKSGVSGATRGTMYHRLMERMDPHENAESALTRLEAGGLTSDIEKSTINIVKVDAFWASELGVRFKIAYDCGKGFRERQFIMALPVREVLEDVNLNSESETVMIQGVVDMYFEEPDGLVLVDYKTDRVSSEDVLIARYRIQLDYYAKALERVTGKTVKEKWIYSFSLNKGIRV